MKLAAVDIGSNAIRLQITKVTFDEGVPHFKKQEFIRFPLRLGKDVFTLGKIRYETEEKFIKLMKAFKNFIDLYEVDDVKICATSAMRDSENGKSIVKRVYYNIGLKIDIIKGEEEATYINDAIYKFLDDGNYLHIDVGGGSTELNVIVNKKKIASKSFKMGSLRRLYGAELNNRFEEISEWIEEHTDDIKGGFNAIGTGGNINKVYELSSKAIPHQISYHEAVQVRTHIMSFSYEDRIKKLKLNKDRADVIIPASRIYLECMKYVEAEKIIVPKVGLKDGIIYNLYKKNKERHFSDDSEK